MNLEDLKTAYEHCELCPRRCGADRRSRKGFCGAGTEIRAAKAMLHPWEEPAVGIPAGTVFFSGCTLGCLYCQNYRISHEGVGKTLSPEELARVFLDLQDKGAKNIDLVTPTHYLPGILTALDLCGDRLQLPIVYNCGGYERKEVIEMLEDTVDIWLPDIKYYSNETARKYSGAGDYFEVAVTAVQEMLRQVKGKESKKLILRHMVLPGQKEDSIRLLRELAERIGTEGYLLSLMSQYTPFYKAHEHPEIDRRVTSYEYGKVLDEAVRLGFDGFMQERTSAKEEYTPSFDLEGL